MTKEQAIKEATELFENTKSAFADDETRIRWIADAIKTAADAATSAEKDRIELWIGKAPQGAIDEMLRNARFRAAVRKPVRADEPKSEREAEGLPRKMNRAERRAQR